MTKFSNTNSAHHCVCVDVAQLVADSHVMLNLLIDERTVLRNSGGKVDIMIGKYKGEENNGEEHDEEV